MNVPGTITSILAILLAAAAGFGLLYRAMRRQAYRDIQAAYHQAEARSNELVLLKNLAETLNQTLPPERSLEVGLEQVAHQVGAASGWILTITPDKKSELAAGYRLPANIELASTRTRTWALCACLKETLNGQLNTPRQFHCERLTRAAGTPEDQRTHLSVPVRASGTPVGIMNLVFASGRQFSEEEMRLLATLGDQFGGAVERLRLFQDVQKLAATDSLTGLYNRRHFMESAEKELERVRRYERPISLAILDIDFFKQINDTYGHLAGDQVLIETSGLCQKSIRRIDLIGRFGGEELIILMPETTPEKAGQAMERLRKDIEALEIQTQRGTVRFTASIGVASLEGHHTLGLQLFVDKADQALYEAKKSGRNRVCML